MSRGLDYNRDFKRRKATRRKTISEKVFGFSWYDNLNQYCDNKIHCSCPCCKPKTNTSKYKSRGPVDPNRHHSMKFSGSGHKNWKASDKRKIERMEYCEW